MENNNLVIYKLANSYKVVNVNSTSDKVRQITKYVQAYVKIGFYKTRPYLFITQLENKEIMIGYIQI